MARRSSSSKVQHTADSEVSIEARPVAQRYDSVAPEHLSRLNAMTLNAATPNCLIVDDNVINLRIMKMYCETRKFPYTTAVDGLQAVYKYKEAVAGIPINLILLDLQMPNCDGIEACEQIRDFEAKEGLSPAAIFIVTGQDSPTDRTKSFEAGADKFFVKPLALKSLDRGIADVFDDNMKSAPDV